MAALVSRGAPSPTTGGVTPSKTPREVTSVLDAVAVDALSIAEKIAETAGGKASLTRIGPTQPVGMRFI
jgi:hypothetical protein